MKIYEFTELSEDISMEASLKNIVDIMSTELPDLYRKLGAMAENFAKNHGEIDHRFNFISGGPKSQWFNNVFLKALKPALYNLARNIPKHLRSDLSDFLNDTIGEGKFSDIERRLIPLLGTLGAALKNKQLSSAAHAAKLAVKDFHHLVAKINAEQDDYDEPETTPAAPNPVAQQNAEVDRIINDTLSRIDRRQAGEIRNIISRQDNKLHALQQELTRRGITIN